MVYPDPILNDLHKSWTSAHDAILVNMTCSPGTGYRKLQPHDDLRPVTFIDLQNKLNSVFPNGISEYNLRMYLSLMEGSGAIQRAASPLDRKRLEITVTPNGYRLSQLILGIEGGNTNA